MGPSCVERLRVSPSEGNLSAHGIGQVRIAQLAACPTLERSNIANPVRFGATLDISGIRCLLTSARRNLHELTACAIDGRIDTNAIPENALINRSVQACLRGNGFHQHIPCSSQFLVQNTHGTRVVKQRDARNVELKT